MNTENCDIAFRNRSFCLLEKGPSRDQKGWFCDVLALIVSNPIQCVHGQKIKKPLLVYICNFYFTMKSGVSEENQKQVYVFLNRFHRNSRMVRLQILYKPFFTNYLYKSAEAHSAKFILYFLAKKFFVLLVNIFSERSVFL